jgi:hypothetical protein
MEQKLSPFQAWANGRVWPDGIADWHGELLMSEMGWHAALQWAKTAIAKEHGTESTLIHNINRILEDGQK